MVKPFVPRDLTIPEPGSVTARAVLSQALGRVGRELPSVARNAPRSARAEAVTLHDLVHEAFAASTGALVSAVRRPTIGGLVRCLRDPQLPNRDAVFSELLAQLAFELALSGALPRPVHVPRAPARLLSIPARLALSLPPSTRALLFEPTHLTVEHDGGPTRINFATLPSSPEGPLGGSGAVHLERPYHALSGTLVLALADNNPLALFEAHPDKSGNVIDLGGHGVAEWVASLGTALDRIGRHLPDLRAEMDFHLSQLVPVGWDPVKHLSASYQEILGTAYLTLHPSQMTLSEALLHEFSHNKLNALFELDDVLENAWSPLYSSPVRPDPRPLHGVLLAVHAFLPVARLYERMIASGDPEAKHEDFRGRFAEIRRINHEGAEVLLDAARPTQVGRGLIEEIRRWDQYYAGFGEG